MRILILYASIGSGHRVSANAIAEALGNLAPEAEVIQEDVLIRLPAIDDVIPDVLSALALAVFPGVYDRLWSSERLAELAQSVYELKPIRERVQQLLTEHRPHVVIGTHAFPCAIAAECKAAMPAAERYTLIAVPTDYHLHPYWPVNHVDAYAAPTYTARGELIDRGFPEQQVRVLGIPIRPQFGDASQVARLRQQWDLQEGDKLVTLLAGGGRPGPYVGILSKVLQIINIITEARYAHIRWHIVCGRNSPIEAFVRRQTADAAHVRVFGYVDDLPLHLQASDLVATKPGGLIISECLAAGKAIALLSLGAGQEAANARFLQDMGVGLYAENAQDLIRLIAELLADDSRLQRISQRAQALGRPRAAIELARWVLELYRTPSHTQSS